ncbi:MAG: Ig-like domain-containing protein [Candidatus Rokuibacteriota bacterium]
MSAGPDLTVTLPASAALAGTAGDDGLPDPPARLTVAWSKTSGPGSVTFADPAAATTTATFSAPGDYVLRLDADDGVLKTGDEAGVVVQPVVGQDVKPTVSILSPTDGSTVSKQVTVAVQAQDDVKVAKVSILVDGAELKAFTAPPFSAAWDSAKVADGDHVIKAIAVDSGGQSAEVSVQVKTVNSGGGGPPTGGTGGLFGGALGTVLMVAMFAVVAALVIAAILLSKRKRRSHRPQPDWQADGTPGAASGWTHDGARDGR